MPFSYHHYFHCHYHILLTAMRLYNVHTSTVPTHHLLPHFVVAASTSTEMWQSVGMRESERGRGEEHLGAGYVPVVRNELILLYERQKALRKHD